MHVGISAFSAWMLGVGSVIGSMAWLFHGYMIARAGALGSVVAWLLGALAFLPVVFILAELSSMFPAAGGPYLYKYYAFKRLLPRTGELFGFLTGWLFYASLLVAYGCMGNGLVNMLAGQMYGSVEASPLWFGPLVIATIFGSTTVINLMKVAYAVRINNVFTVMKFGMVFGFGALVMAAPSSSLASVLNPVNLSGQSNIVLNILSVLTIAIGAYGGLELIACASSETKDARESVPRAMFLTLASLAFIYAGMCALVAAATPYAFSPDKANCVVPGTALPATLPGITTFLVGTFWGRVASAFVICSIFGSALGGLLAFARLGYSLAQTGLFPKQFGQLDPKSKIPVYSLWFQCAGLCMIGISAHMLARFRVFPDAYSYLAETFCFMYLLVVLLYGVSLISLRYTDPDMPRPFRIGRSGNGLAWVTALSAMAIFGTVAFFCTNWIYQVGGLIILLMGVPVYWYYRRQSNGSA
jgi:amino acid transporter